MKSPVTCSVYALRDPRTNELRYIGSTGQTLVGRLRGHKSDKSNGAKYAWICELKALGLEPVIEALATYDSDMQQLDHAFETAKIAIAEEGRLIAEAIADGHSLFNRDIPRLTNDGARMLTLNTAIIQVRITKRQKDILQGYARSRGITIAEVTRELLRALIARIEREKEQAA